MADQVRSDRNADGEIVEMSTGMGINRVGPFNCRFGVALSVGYPDT